MKLSICWVSVFILILLVSCQEVIELDLGNASPRITIEGVITTEQGPYTVKMSQSVDYGETNIFPPVSGASISIFDESGNSELLEEVSAGNYHSRDFQGEQGKTYRLEVEYGDKLYVAASTIPVTNITLDSIFYEFFEESFFVEEGYYLTVLFLDPVDEVNYYRLKVYVNGQPYYFEVDDNLVKDDNFWLIDDKFFNGNMIDFEFPHKLKAGDKVDVELHQVDKETFDYYRTLVEMMGQGGVAPSNPLTNWTNGALGYFGAISINYGSIDIEAE